MESLPAAQVSRLPFCANEARKMRALPGLRRAGVHDPDTGQCRAIGRDGRPDGAGDAGQSEGLSGASISLSTVSDDASHSLHHRIECAGQAVRMTSVASAVRPTIDDDSRDIDRDLGSFTPPSVIPGAAHLSRPRWRKGQA